MKKKVADECLKLFGNLPYLPDREALKIMQVLNTEVRRRVYTADRAWSKKGVRNNG